MLYFIPANGQISGIDHWEMLITSGQEWRYFPGTEEPSSAWNSLEFDDSEWELGVSGIGYGDGDDMTEIDPVVALYMRKEFSVVDKALIVQAILYMDYDDAFVAYLNGVEIARANVSGEPPGYATQASSLHEALMYRGINPEEFRIKGEIFTQVIHEGRNVLAVQVHNHDPGSSDMSSIPFLCVGMSDPGQTYLDVPQWFSAPVDYTMSELPIISINTYNRTIPDEPKIPAWLSVIDNGQGRMNSQYDPATGYNGWINIEIRGESAQMFPKKSYSFETQDSLGENNNVPLLDLPVENDWILYGPYSDKTLIKNVLTYRLTRDMGRYATRTKFCELFINDEYRGLYVLMEKIKQDKNRVDISKLNVDDISGDQLTGGYILRIDKLDPNDYPSWISMPSGGLQGGEEPITFQYFDPGGFDLQDVQRVYIRNWIEEFERVLNSQEYLDPVIGFKAYIDIPSFIDFLIINELSKNIDAYIFSTYLYKERDSKGGKLYMGPVWDFNISYGNVDYNDDVMMPYGWIYDDGWRMYWFRRMMKDRVFSNTLNCRWHELRSNIFSNERILNIIDSLVTVLDGPIQKNYKKWPVLGTYIWPNVFIGETYEEEIEQLKSWLIDRLAWMDDHIPMECVTGLYPIGEGVNDIQLYPNPFEDIIYIQLKSPGSLKSIQLMDRSGRMILRLIQDDERKYNFFLSWDDINLEKLHSGIYIALIELSNGKMIYKKLIKN
jgi:hypothetical protein